jgi:hypothetical protein
MVDNLTHGYCFILVQLHDVTVARYSSALRLTNSPHPISYLARAIASSTAWQELPSSILVISTPPRPLLAVLGRFDDRQTGCMVAQASVVSQVMQRVRYVDYQQAEQDCLLLADKLLAFFGHDELSSFAFTAIPRGGHIVLGMLAYILNLNPSQVNPTLPSNIPLVVVDDCCLTGLRMGSFLDNYKTQQIIFAHLYSHPELRSAVEARESRVVACLSAQDLHDHGPDIWGEKYTSMHQEWLNQIGANRYWTGVADHICFAWNEPDRPVWLDDENPITGWRLIPPEMCLKNRPTPGARTPEIQVQLEGPGPWKPTNRVLFGEMNGKVIIGNTENGETFGLADTAADMWKALVTYGEMDTAVKHLALEYEVDEARLRRDMQAFADDLRAKGLLELEGQPAGG